MNKSLSDKVVFTFRKKKQQKIDYTVNYIYIGFLITPLKVIQYLPSLYINVIMFLYLISYHG